ncbi:MAG: DUF6499 domain-containing protein [Rhizobiaceae bacterium]
MGARCEDFVARIGKTAGDYAYTESLTDSDWAWEFLRRNPDYRADYYESRVRTTKTVSHPSGVRIHRARGYHHNAKKWGLAVFADPDLNALQTDIFWSQEVLSHSVLASSTIVESAEDEADLDLFRDRNCTAILCDPDRQKIIVRSRNAAIGMKLVGVSVLFQPVQLQFHLQGFASIGSGTKALVWIRNALKSLRAADRRALTNITRANRKKYLVALDCEQKGASLRDTALVFRALRLTRLRWSSGNEALKKQVWRCRNSGLKLMQDGYRKLL